MSLNSGWSGSTLGGTPAGPGVPARARSARIRDEINGKMLYEEVCGRERALRNERKVQARSRFS